LTNVIGVIDGTLIPIIAPKDNEADFVCRKGFHAINVQAVADDSLRYEFLWFILDGSNSKHSFNIHYVFVPSWEFDIINPFAYGRCDILHCTARF
jgi:hypothetical protein